MKRVIGLVLVFGVSFTATDASPSTAKVALSPPAKPAKAKITLADLAPADEYFGPLKLSVVGIGNTLRDIGLRYDVNHDIGAQTLATATLTESSVRDWARKYPKDDLLPHAIYVLQRLYSKILLQSARDKAKATASWLFSSFANSPQAKQLHKTMANEVLPPLPVETAPIDLQPTIVPATPVPTSPVPAATQSPTESGPGFVTPAPTAAPLPSAGTTPAPLPTAAPGASPAPLPSPTPLSSATPAPTRTTIELTPHSLTYPTPIPTAAGTEVPTAAPLPSPTPSSEPPTAAPSPAPQPSPTATPAPKRGRKSAPAATPAPTDTPAPAETPAPSASPTPAAQTNPATDSPPAPVATASPLPTPHATSS